ncbi:MAG: LytTR family DNA-binding domain-containing protein [Bacteroidales bacterium]|jgi:DNA-binding LytR/AlgR family response regulator|nr:LytTR family DNA-binding domain-containing protein [Bacteroidales bacterium]
MIRCIVIDDTPLAIEKLEAFIVQVPLLHHLQSFSNGLEAVMYMKTNSVDLVFLDIQMEQFTGLQFIEALQYRPKIVIVSAYNQYAVQGFDYNVTDYLLKPYSFERFLKAVDRVQAEMQVKTAKNYMFVKTEYRMERVDFSDILFVEGQGAYLRIVTQQTKIMTIQNFQSMEEILPSDNFVRVHKSYIVAMDKIESIERNVIQIAGIRIPVGKNYQNKFYRRL